MIAYVKGTLEQIEADSAIIDCSGIGYRVYTPIEPLTRLGIGSEVKLHTYFSVREDAQTLYGFLRPEMLDLFQLLIAVNGVGPKYALGILTELSTDTVVSAIATGDYKTLTQVSGIGPKTAQRIVVDLKDKVGLAGGADIEAMINGERVSVGTAFDLSSPMGEAVSVLMTLGFHRQEAKSVLEKLDSEGKDTETLVNEALRALSD